MRTQPDPAPHSGDASLLDALAGVRQVMAASLAGTPLHFIVTDYEGLMGNGKMLRARLAFRVGPATGVPYRTLLNASAAVEMIHAASLLHDDVIDGGYLRRGAPSFWVERGIPGAILLGDLLLFKALDLICAVEEGRLMPRLVQLTGEVCEAEAEQELVLRGTPSGWEQCVSIARRKTGALFAFIGYVCGAGDDLLARALQESGYKAGTAYQLADDILDATGDPDAVGKTLGSDEARAKTTAAKAAARDRTDPVEAIENLCADSTRALRPWPAVQQAWDAYMAGDFRPTVDQHLACFTR
jgi:geranylgeranyl pyrophosphate synthase